MTEIADARVALRDMLVLHTADVLDPERVHLYTPSIVASPCIWIAQPGTNTVIAGNGSRLRTISFPIVIVADGYDQPQCELLDELVARVSDAIYALPRSEDGGASPESLDIGGTVSRAVVHDVVITVFAHSFCPQPVPVP